LTSTKKLIVKCLTSNKIFIFAKGNYEIIVPFISDENDLEILDEILKSQVGFFVKPLLFVFKELTNEESTKFMNDLRIAKLSHIGVDKKIKAVYKTIEKDLKYLGIVGLEYVIYEDSINTIKTLNDAGVKT
jgi:Cation transport ATPase